jgi:hypothetical protein
VDSLYGAAAFAMLAKATGRREYLDTMQAFFDDVTGELWDEEAGLYYRDNRYIGQKTANGKAMGGLMRSLGADGRVEWGQQVDHRPNAAARESTHEYVTGTFLLAASEVYKMKR